MSADPDHEDHEHDAHEGSVNHGLRIPSSLSPDADLAMSQTIGCAIAVHRALGLESRNLAYEKERSIRVTYRGVEIPGQRVDFIVEGLIVLEIKAVARIDQVHRAQLISYLKTTGLHGGLLINFRVPLLKDGIRRVVA